MKRIAPAVLALALLLFSSARAQAANAGDAALTVALSTVSGAVLGASTLPFYEDSGKHTKNIFYGAAIGAVTGVLIAAFAGVKEGEEVEDEARLQRLIHPESTAALRPAAPSSPKDLLVWAPIKKFRF